MMIEAAPVRDMNDAKEIKVKIPLDFHVKLHTLKVLKGQSISDTVEIALARYFEQFPNAERVAVADATARAVRTAQAVVVATPL